MVRVDAADGAVTFTVVGLHKVWALRSRIRISATDILDVGPGEPLVREEGPGWRVLGTSLPGVITAGIYFKDGRWSFWDVVRPSNTIAVTIKGHRFSRLIVEVDDPIAAIARLQHAAAELRAPSNNALQLTKLAQAMELRS